MTDEPTILDKIDYTIIGSYTREESLEYFHKGVEAGFSRFCFSAEVANYIYGSIHKHSVNHSIVINFPIPNIDFTPLNHMEEHLLESLNYNIDVVIPRSCIRQDDHDFKLRIVLGQLKYFKSVYGTKEIKAIIETGNLTGYDIEWISKKLVQDGTVDYVKTCTGFGPRGVSTNDIRLIRQYTDKIKASGGIKSLRQIQTLEKAGASIYGVGFKSAIIIAEQFRRQAEWQKNKVGKN